MIDTSEYFNKLRLIPSFYLLMILYFFMIDIITVRQLGYETKDLFFLIDLELVAYITAMMLAVFTIIGLIVKKSFFTSFFVVILATIIYSLGNDFRFDIVKSNLNSASIIFIFIAFLAYNAYDKIIDHLHGQVFYIHLVYIVMSILIVLSLYGVSQQSFNNWKTLKFDKGKIQLSQQATYHTIFESKSFTPARLQSLNQSLEVYANKKIINELSENIFETKLQDKNLILIPYDDSPTNGYQLTVNYYDVGDIKNIFIINPDTCNINQCDLHTLIVRRRHKSDITKGFNLISKYSRKVGVSNFTTNMFTDFIEEK